MDLDRKIHTRFGVDLSLEREKGWPCAGFPALFWKAA